MTAGVYAIINTVNNMAYIGSSVNIERRWCCHRSDLKLGIGPSKSIVAAWRAAGPDGFRWTILELVDGDEDALESSDGADVVLKRLERRAGSGRGTPAAEEEGG
jgi:hypothetical protein